MEIAREKNWTDTYDYRLTNQDKSLTILFARNLDLYMMMNDDQLMQYGESKTIQFDITKENYEVFCLFDSLYQDIISYHVLDLESVDTLYHSEYSKLVDEHQSIHWISDEGLEDVEDSFTLSKVDNDTYRFTFYRNEKNPDFGFKNPKYISVRIRNSGSRYDPFNCVFMKMYHELQEIDPEYHQIHFEELPYMKKLVH